MKCALICGSSDCTADCFNNKADDVHRFGFLFVRACLVETVRERDRVKIGTPSSGIALPFVVWAHITPDESDEARRPYPATCDGGHATLKFARPKENRL
jgi:hypothetical protein